MKTNSRVSPEQRELEAKRSELAGLEAELAQRELDLTTLHAELRVFEARYFRVVGLKFAERDELDARIAEAVARKRPQDNNIRQQAAEARTRATESAIATSRAFPSGGDEPFTPTEDLRRLYREIAKRAHPDLTIDNQARERRTQVMTAANLAYAEGDEARLRLILEEWETSPDSVEGEGIAAELVRAIRKIHQVKQRLTQIEAELGKLRQSDLYELKEQADVARTGGQDLLVVMANQLDAEIAALQSRLRALSVERVR